MTEARRLGTRASSPETGVFEVNAGEVSPAIAGAAQVEANSACETLGSALPFLVHPVHHSGELQWSDLVLDGSSDLLEPVLRHK